MIQTGPSGRKREALVYGLGAVVCWSLLASSVVLAVRAMDPWLTLFYSLGFSSLFLAMATLATGRWKRLAEFRGEQGLRSLALGVYGIAGYHFCYYLAFTLAPRAETNTLNYLWPLLTVVLGMLIDRSLFRWSGVWGAVLGFAGVVLVIAGGKGVQLEGDYALGYALAVGGALVWASYSVLLGRRQLEPISSNLAFNTITCVLAGLMVVWMGVFRLPSLNEAAGLAFTGAVPIAGGALFWQAGLNRGDPTILGNLSFVIPFLSSFFLWVLAGVEFAPTALGGLVFIVGGAWLGIGGVARAETTETPRHKGTRC